MKAIITRSSETRLYHGEVIGVPGTQVKSDNLADLKEKLDVSLAAIRLKSISEVKQQFSYVDIIDM